MKKRPILWKAIAVGIAVAIIAVLAIVLGDKTAEGSWYERSFMALVPPLFAIALALITKEVYSSLFIGVLTGALLYANFNPMPAADALINEGLINAIADTAGIFLFLVVLGIIVALVNAAGGSQAFGRWAETHIKTRAGAALATFALGVMIFIDDYFNCLTVGGVMRPVTDSHKISRPKLAYLIDATAAPICMIAPISSWAAAVSEYVADGQGLKFFCMAIPFNFYSILTLVFIVVLSIMGFDYGKMAGFEIKARKGDVSALKTEQAPQADEPAPRGRVFDLILPIVVLIVLCVLALLYVGEFFMAGSEYYLDLAGAFGNTDATVALPMGSIAALIIIVVYFIARRLLTFNEAMKAFPKGFIAMVPAIFILALATALKNITGLLGAKYYVEGLIAQASGIQWLLPALIFLAACGLAFATGTSWGTFGILIPIVSQAFGLDSTIGIIAMSACLAGAVCGDHCSPISDTTIMSSAGADCNHLDHVATQMPYSLTVAAVSAVAYLLTGILYQVGMQNYTLWLLALPIAIAMMVGTLFVIRFIQKKKAAKQPAESEQESPAAENAEP